MARRLSDSAFRRRGKNFPVRTVLAWLFLLGLAAIPLLVLALRPAHDFEGKCSLCHLTPPSGGKMIFVKEIDFLCKDCHRDLGLSHPSGLKPTMALPDLFPLDWGGRMTCATCHDVHGNGEALLRGEGPGRLFCFACHQGTMGTHSGSGESAHSRSAAGERGFEVRDPGNPIDRQSLECLGCHDSALGSPANVRVGIGSGIWNDRNGNSHPIGIAYMDAYRKGGLRHPMNLDPAVRLFDGRVGCGSCHNIYSKERYYLVMSNRGSALCFACHKK